MRNHIRPALFVVSILASVGQAARAQEAANTAEFTLTDFRDAASGLSLKRPTSWTQDSTFKGGARFAGGDEWLTVQIVRTAQTPQAYLARFNFPATEKKIGIKPFKQGSFNALVQSSSAQGQSGVTGKPLSLLIDRWVFSPRAGQLAVLTVSGPQKVFDWEGNRDMALSLRLR